jgi:hypothetical protein
MMESCDWMCCNRCRGSPGLRALDQAHSVWQVLNLVAFEGVDVRADHLQALTELIEKVDSHQVCARRVSCFACMLIWRGCRVKSRRLGLVRNYQIDRQYH